jgi:hypothetical protein
MTPGVQKMTPGVQKMMRAVHLLWAFLEPTFIVIGDLEDSQGKKKIKLKAAIWVLLLFVHIRAEKGLLSFLKPNWGVTAGFILLSPRFVEHFPQETLSVLHAWAPFILPPN